MLFLFSFFISPDSAALRPLRFEKGGFYMKKYIALTVFCLAVAVTAVCMGRTPPEILGETADVSYSQTAV